SADGDDVTRTNDAEVVGDRVHLKVAHGGRTTTHAAIVESAVHLQAVRVVVVLIAENEAPDAAAGDECIDAAALHGVVRRVRPHDALGGPANVAVLDDDRRRDPYVHGSELQRNALSSAVAEHLDRGQVRRRQPGSAVPDRDVLDHDDVRPLYTVTTPSCPGLIVAEAVGSASSPIGT